MKPPRNRSLGRRLTSKIQIYFTPTEKEYIQRACAKIGVKLSKYGAETMLNRARKILGKSFSSAT